jgi:ribosome-interacting GTPase 1
MPTNLPPDYYEIEKRFRSAESAAEKVSLLEEMYSVVPKHKGTDHLRADLRRQISKYKEEAVQTHKKHGGHTPVFHIDKEGAGQVALIGPTNTGKSSLVRALTKAEPEVSAAPYSTWKPTPGMMPVENIQVQLIDTPPMNRGYVEPGLFDLIRRADLALIIVDLQADPLQQLEDTLLLMREHHIAPRFSTPEAQKRLSRNETTSDEARLVYVPAFVVANKCDDESQDDSFAVLCELFEGRCPFIPVSAKTGRNFEQLKQVVFEQLEVVRVYAKPPGEPADMERPFVLKKGSTVAELARMIHRDFYEKLKSARVWGSTVFEGQMVQRDYLLQDGDIVELKV